MNRIKAKNKTCIKCGSDSEPHFSNKMCRRCASISYAEKSKQNKKGNYKKPDKDLSDAFFNEMINSINLNPYSFESGKVITNPDRKNVAHLLPKKIYSSVKFKSDCWTPLTWDEHTRYDHLLDLYKFDELVKEFPKTSHRLFTFVVTNLDTLEEHKLKKEIINYLVTSLNKAI